MVYVSWPPTISSSNKSILWFVRSLQPNNETALIEFSLKSVLNRRTLCSNDSWLTTGSYQTRIRTIKKGNSHFQYRRNKRGKDFSNATAHKQHQDIHIHIHSNYYKDKETSTTKPTNQTDFEEKRSKRENHFMWTLNSSLFTIWFLNEMYRSHRW